MKTRNILALTMLVLGLIFAACSDDDAGAVNNLLFVTEAPSTSLARAVNPYANVIFTDFRISIRQVEFKLAGMTNSDPADIVFEGPFVLDLLNPGSILQQTIGSTNIQAGLYTAIIFKLHKTTDGGLVALETNHPLYDRSIYVAGTINGTNFAFHHDPSGELMVRNTNGFTIASNSTTKVVLRFNLQSLLDVDALIDLTSATDNSGDSFFDLSANSPDGDNNKSIADDLKNNVKKIIDFYNE